MTDKLHINIPLSHKNVTMQFIDHWFGDSSADDIASTIADLCGSDPDAEFMVRAIGTGLMLQANSQYFHSNIHLIVGTDNGIQLIQVVQMHVERGGVKAACETLTRQVRGALSLGKNEIKYGEGAIQPIGDAPPQSSPSHQWQEAGLMISSPGIGVLRFSPDDDYRGLSRLKSVFTSDVGDFDKAVGVKVPGDGPIDDEIKKIPIQENDVKFSKTGYNVKVQQISPEQQAVVKVLFDKLNMFNEELSAATSKMDAAQNMKNRHGASRFYRHTISELDAIARQCVTTSSTTVFRTENLTTSNPVFRQLIKVGTIVKRRWYQKVMTKQPATDDNVLITITIPKGTSIFVDGSDTAILNRNTQMRVKQVHRSGDGKFHIVTEVVK